MGRFLALWLLAIVATVFLLGSARGQTACVNSFEEAVETTKRYGEEFRFAAVNSIGVVLFMFSGPRSFTIFFQDPQGRMCTAPALVGDVTWRGQNARS